MSGRGRDRFRGDNPSRFEDKSRSGRNNAPPSRHLWVGNLSHSIGEHDLTDHFVRFGELETVAFQPGRSYAFINFRSIEDAIAAMKALQGFPIAGNQLRIEFTKADKSSLPSRDESYLHHHDEQHSALRRSPFLQRDSRAHLASPESFYPEKSKASDKDAEPSEVLWIGFPSSLKVDEMILRKAFSPFGEIEKITAFPGRSYAFVQFRNVMSACRAKEALQGKLFGNPRVHICFAKSDVASSNNRRSSANVPLSSSPRYKSDHLGFSENFRQDRNFGSLTRDRSRSPPFRSNLDSGDSDVYHYSRKGTSRMGGKNTFEERWHGEVESDLGLPQERFENHISPPRQRGAHLHDFSQKFPQKGLSYEDQWDLPEDAYIFHDAKKLKTGSFLLDNELPEYPFSDLKQQKPAYSRLYSDVPQPEAFDKTFEAGPFRNKQIPDHLMNSSMPQEESGPWKSSFDNFHARSDSLPSIPLERKTYTPEPDQSSIKEWKWEGTIAKGGTPVCRARCFPVGKVLDMILPEFLDCTARTGLDMLAKHYYQAAGAWVVFFVPESDNDMGYYNEFMHYLEEKQRAAVAKLDERTTLFLVPPSDFSEKVLKVPGKLSISGVILRLEQPGSNSGSLHHSIENNDAHLLSFLGDVSYPKQSTSSGPISPMIPFPNLGMAGANNQSLLGNAASSAPHPPFSGSFHGMGGTSDSHNGNRYDQPLQRNPTAGPMWSSHHLKNMNAGSRNVTSTASNSAFEPDIQQLRSAIPRETQFTSSSQIHHTGGISGIPESGNSKLFLQEIKPSGSLSMPVGVLQQEKFAQLASSLLGQQSQAGRTPYVGEGYGPTNTLNQPDNPFTTSQRHTSQNNEVTSELSTSHYAQLQQLQHQHQQQQNQHHQQVSNAPQVPHNVQRDLQAQEAVEEDPQKRLQATLQLAAALLQQIQQGKGT